MNQPSIEKRWKKPRRSKFISSDEGLTNVITTVLIIAIVMAIIIGPYLTVTVPQEIKRNEAAHFEDVKESFMDLRTNVNTQLIEEAPVLSSRIKLGTEDENLFVLGGDGVLYFDPSEMLISIASYYDEQSIFARGSGNIRYESRNLYFSDKNLIYETTGIIVSQRSEARMIVEPDFQLVRRQVTRTIGLDVGFATLGGLGDTALGNIYLSNTGYTNVTFHKARVTWYGGNASSMSSLNIAGGPAEWTGAVASGIIFDFQSNYDLLPESKIVILRFNSDIRDATISIELFSTDNRVVSATWPIVDLYSVANTYDIDFPDFQTVNKIKFKNICESVITLEQMALSWTGSATLWCVEIPGHGGVVWSVPVPGRTSPISFNLKNISMFNPDDIGDVKFYFNGNIKNENLNIKFFAENSTNTATTKYPMDLNETYINASFSIVTLICDKNNVAGKSSRIIKTTLISSEKNKYIWDTGENIILNISTSYGDAWLKYLNNSLVNDANLIWDFDADGAFQGDYYIISNQITDEVIYINLVLNSIYKLECVIGVVEAELG